MPYRRFVKWIAWYKVRAEKEAKAYKDAEAKSKKRSKGGKKLPAGLSED